MQYGGNDPYEDIEGKFVLSHKPPPFAPGRVDQKSSRSKGKNMVTEQTNETKGQKIQKPVRFKKGNFIGKND